MNLMEGADEVGVNFGIALRPDGVCAILRVYDDKLWVQGVWLADCNQTKMYVWLRVQKFDNSAIFGQGFVSSYQANVLCVFIRIEF